MDICWIYWILYIQETCLLCNESTRQRKLKMGSRVKIEILVASPIERSRF